MKNKKYGFTIPELLAVIGRIGILVTIATASYTTISNNMKQKTYDNKIDLIRTKALEYANDNGVDATLISVAKLISDGYLEIENDTEKNEKISNPLGGYLDCYHIKLNCSGLKRTIYMMRFDQVKGRSPCSRCGGK